MIFDAGWGVKYLALNKMCKNLEFKANSLTSSCPFLRFHSANLKTAFTHGVPPVRPHYLRGRCREWLRARATTGAGAAGGSEDKMSIDSFDAPRSQGVYPRCSVSGVGSMSSRHQRCPESREWKVQNGRVQIMKTSSNSRKSRWELRESHDKAGEFAVQKLHSLEILGGCGSEVRWCGRWQENITLKMLKNMANFAFVCNSDFFCTKDFWSQVFWNPSCAMADMQASGTREVQSWSESNLR